MASFRAPCIYAHVYHLYIFHTVLCALMKYNLTYVTWNLGVSAVIGEVIQTLELSASGQTFFFAGKSVSMSLP